MAGKQNGEHRAKRVLVVDDDLDLADALVAFLRGWGLQVDFAINGYAALDVAGRMKPDLIFLDIGLPDFNGWQLARRLRQISGLDGVRIAIVSARGAPEDIRRSSETGCEVHLVKPLDLRTVESLVL